MPPLLRYLAFASTIHFYDLAFESQEFVFLLQKEESQLAKLKKHLKPEEFAAATAKITNRKERLETLQTQYEELEDHYEKIIKRLPA